MTFIGMKSSSNKTYLHSHLYVYAHAYQDQMCWALCIGLNTGDKKSK